LRKREFRVNLPNSIDDPVVTVAYNAPERHFFLGDDSENE
jgi:hypothetical protein